MSSDAVIRTLLLTDMVGSTALTARLGDEAAANLFARTDKLARDLLATHAGIEVDKSDGFLLLFERPIDAVSFALAYHAALAALTRQSGSELLARTGIHLGEVILRHNTPGEVERGAKRLEVEGLSKQLAARTMSLALGGQTLLTRGAFDLARRASAGNDALPPNLQWLAHGPYQFKGAEETVEVFEVGAAGSAPLRPPPNSEKAHRAIRPGEEELLGWRPSAGTEVKRRPGWILERKLGEGGFGEVWLGTHERTHERRVFKFCFVLERLRTLKRELTLFLLMREALGQRDDIQRLYDLNFDEPPYFLEMDYSDGGDLEDWSAAQGGASRVPMDLRLALVAQVAEAAAAAHSLGILHKDIKPRNVLIDNRSGSPRARLTDFGIGQLADKSILEQVRIQATGFTEDTLRGTELSSRTGTRLYMAPELLAGKLPSIQSDVYALGVLLYQMLVGDFSQAVTVDWAQRIADPILRGDLGECLAGDPGKRLASARELARRIEELPARRRARRRRALVRGALIGAAILSVAFVAALFFIQRERTRADREQGLRQSAERNLYNSLIRTAESAIAASDLDQARKDLESAPPDYRQWEWGVLVAESHPEVWDLGKVGSLTGGNTTASLDPTGRLLATGAADGRLDIWSLATGGNVFRHEGGRANEAGANTLAFSPDGSRLLAGFRDEELLLFDTRDWRIIWRGAGQTVNTNLPRPLPAAGRVFPCIQDGRQLTLRLMQDGSAISPPLRHPFTVVRVAMSADMTTAYTCGWAKTACAWDVKSGERIGEVSLDVVGYRELQPMPDGHGVALVPDWPDRKIRLWDARAGTLRTIECTGHHSLTFSPDGRYLVTNYENGGIQFYDLLEDRNLGVLEGTVDSSYLAFSPDGSRLICQSLLGRLLVYDWATVLRLKTGKTLRYEETHGLITSTGISRGYTGSFSVSGDGNLAVAGYLDGSAVLWDTSGLPGSNEFYKLWAGVRDATTSRDGSILAQAYTGSIVRVWDVNARRIISHVATGWGNVERIGLSADGSTLVCSTRAGATWSTPSTCVAVTADTATGRILHEFVATTLSADAWQTTCGAAITPDGRRVALSVNERTLGIYDARSGQLLADLGSRQGLVRAIAIDPSGRFLAASDSTGRLALWDLSGRLLHELIGDPGVEVREIEFLPDASSLLAGGQDGSIRVFDLAGGRMVDSWRGASGLILDLTAHPTEPRVLVTSSDTTQAIDSLEPGHARLFNLRLPHRSPELWGSFTADGRSLIVTQGSGRNTIIPTAPILRDAKPHEIRSAIASSQQARIQDWRRELAIRRESVVERMIQGRAHVQAADDSLQTALALILQAGDLRRAGLADDETSRSLTRAIDQLYAAARIGDDQPAHQLSAYAMDFADRLGIRGPALAMIGIDAHEAWRHRSYRMTRTHAQDLGSLLRGLSRCVRDLGLATEADALLRRGAAANLVADQILAKDMARELHLAGLQPPPPPPERSLFDSEGLIPSILEEIGGIGVRVTSLPADQFDQLRRAQDASVLAYLDAVAPLPDMPALRATIAARLPPPPPPRTTVGDITGPIMASIRSKRDRPAGDHPPRGTP